MRSKCETFRHASGATGFMWIPSTFFFLRSSRRSRTIFICRARARSKIDFSTGKNVSGANPTLGVVTSCPARRISYGREKRPSPLAYVSCLHSRFENAVRFAYRSIASRHLTARDRRDQVSSEGKFSRPDGSLSGNDLYSHAIKIALRDRRLCGFFFSSPLVGFPVAASRRKLRALYMIARFMANS